MNKWMNYFGLRLGLALPNRGYKLQWWLEIGNAFLTCCFVYHLPKTVSSTCHRLRVFVGGLDV